MKGLLSQRIVLKVDVEPENILFAGASLHPSARNFSRLGGEGVNFLPPFLSGEGREGANLGRTLSGIPLSLSKKRFCFSISVFLLDSFVIC